MNQDEVSHPIVACQVLRAQNPRNRYVEAMECQQCPELISEGPQGMPEEIGKPGEVPHHPQYPNPVPIQNMTRSSNLSSV